MHRLPHRTPAFVLLLPHIAERGPTGTSTSAKLWGEINLDSMGVGRFRRLDGRKRNCDVGRAGSRATACRISPLSWVDAVAARPPSTPPLSSVLMVEAVDSYQRVTHPNSGGRRSTGAKNVGVSEYQNVYGTSVVVHRSIGKDGRFRTCLTRREYQKIDSSQ